MKNTIEKNFHLLSPIYTNVIAILIFLTATTNSATAQTINGNDVNLKSAISAASYNNGIVTIGTITMRNNQDGVVLGSNGTGGAKTNLTIRGVTASNFEANIIDIISRIGASGNNISGAEIQTIFSQKTFNTNALSVIQGSSGNRAGSDKEVFANGYKWFTTISTAPSSGNGLSFQNISFKDVSVVYDFNPTSSGSDIGDGNRKFVNGLIGNSHSAGTVYANQQRTLDSSSYGTTLGKITGNEFSNISIKVLGKLDTNYLAGGGIIGVRNTGEVATGSTTQGSKLTVPLSAEMDVVSGNYFHNLSVITTNETDSGYANSAYIEGGGIIGVDGVSTPDTSIGHALLKGLANNAFNDITIRSNDVLLGGGVVGVNNNSKDKSGNVSDGATYARIDYVTGNIFGDGDENSIKVDIGYSLRGGGVVGINGLGSAEILLQNLEKNVFAGIDVNVGTYIKGGGIIGLQNNDDDYDKEGISAGSFESAEVRARNVSDNVFVNLDVTVGSNTGGSSQYLQGGGVIGVRSNYGIAQIENVNDNVFKDIKIDIQNATDTGEGLFGGGVVGVYSVSGYSRIGTARGNYFDGVSVSVAGTITGGGVVGAANAVTSNITPVIADNILNNTFRNTTVTTTAGGDIVGGGIIGVSSPAGLSDFNNVSNNSFIGASGTEVTVAGKIEGGGVIGVRTGGPSYLSGSILNNVSNNTIAYYDVKVNGTDGIEGGGMIGIFSDTLADIENFNSNIFSNNKVTASKINGGGVVGVRAETGFAQIITLDGNQFATTEVSTTGDLEGGGIIGVRAANGNASIGTASNNTFNGSTITSGNNIEGGGVIGVRSATSGTAKIGTINNNTFNTTKVTTTTTGKLEGGGIIGVRAQDGDSEIGTANNNTFANSTITIKGDIEGGGIIGVRSENTGSAKIGTIDNNTFDTTKVSTEGKLEGGGIIGVRAKVALAEIENISNSKFINSTISSDGDLEGGGIIGIRTDANGAAILDTLQNNTFSGTTITSGGTIEGGGVIGVRVDDEGIAMIGNIDSTEFTGIKVTSTNELEGGGIIGVRAKENDAAIESVSNSKFSNNEINIGGHIQGGGIVSVRTDARAYIDSVSNTTFSGNKVTAGTWIDGGGILGVSGSAKDTLNATNPHAGIGLIDKVNFTNNTINAKNGQIMGGLVYSYGAADGMIIKDSRFIDNEFHSTVTGSYTGITYNAKVYGAVTIDTGATPYDDNSEHVVTISSTSNDPLYGTMFYDNAIYETGGADPDRYNSLYFGTMPYIDSGAATSDFAAANAKLIVAPEVGGTVFLLDPITASQQNDTGGQFTFNMEVGKQNGDASGTLIWAGKNTFEHLKSDGSADTDRSGSLTMYAGSTTTLIDKSSKTTLVNVDKIWSDIFDDKGKVSTMDLDAPNYTVNLKQGALLNVEGHHYWDLSTDAGSDPKVNFNGTLHFNLNNTQVYDNKTTPQTYSATGAGVPLLTIDTPNKTGMIDLNGALVQLQNFVGDPLVDGDRFYLVAVVDDTTGQNNFTAPSNQLVLSNAKDSEGNYIAYARQGLTRGYNFIIDLNGEHTESGLVDTHYLTARIKAKAPTPGKPEPRIPVPSKELVPPADGRITGVSFLGHLSTPQLYEIDPQCDVQCEPCAPCDQVGGGNRGGKWIRTPFASIAGDWYRVNTADTSHFDIRSSVFQAGFAFQKKAHCGSKIFFAAFFDSGSADYNTFNYLSDVTPKPDIRADGELTTTGGGLLFRKQWKCGWRFDGIVRGGNLRNEFYSDDIDIHDTDFIMQYKINSAYFGTDLGINRQWKLGKKRTLDLYGKYIWAYLEANTVTWQYTDNNGKPYEETVIFDSIQSHRVKLGTRYTKKRDKKLSWYLGGGYEYEFDGQADGHAVGVGDFRASALRGGFGFGEMGLIYRRSDRFQLAGGLEGYTGDRTGGRIDFAAIWKW